MKWVVEINDKRLVVEVQYGKIYISGAGQLFINGKQVKAWGRSPWGLPKVVPFKIEGKSAVLRRRSLLDQNFDLLVDGKLIKKAKKGEVD